MTEEKRSGEDRAGASNWKMPSPTPAMRKDPIWTAIYDTIKSWDVSVPALYAGYCGANGSHATLIYMRIAHLLGEERANAEERPERVRADLKHIERVARNAVTELDADPKAEPEDGKSS